MKEFVTYKKDIPASQHYDGKVSIYTKKGFCVLRNSEDPQKDEKRGSEL